ncbi:Crp/Fnr family transcriptional regulator [Nocardia sp. NPDC058666]|uniref:Crp/Fnr family transcriptional regulator n=1 Tax=Actinomycetes TaxID=1760 RepID=UPI00365D4A93
MIDSVTASSMVAFSGRRTWTHEAAERYLRAQGLPAHVIEMLIDSARLQAGHDGQVLAHGAEWIHILIRGVVKETTPHGTTRLWAKGAIFGDLNQVMLRPGAGEASGRRPLKAGSRLTFLTTGATLSLTVTTLARLIDGDPALVLFLAQRTQDRSLIVESVYSASKADPAVRVARLLNYLVRRRGLRQDGELSRIRMTRTGVHGVPDGALTVTGPSQADIAEALGLGRTTVEKAIASLRSQDILSTLEPGTRSNRYYEIRDARLLRSLARSDG